MSQTQGDEPPGGRLTAPPLPCLAAVLVDCHTVALGYAYTEGSVVPGWLWALTAITYGWLVLNLILLIIPSHQSVHDRLALTVVRVQKIVATP